MVFFSLLNTSGLSGYASHVSGVRVPMLGMKFPKTLKG